MSHLPRHQRGLKTHLAHYEAQLRRLGIDTTNLPAEPKERFQELEMRRLRELADAYEVAAPPDTDLAEVARSTGATTDQLHTLAAERPHLALTLD